MVRIAIIDSRPVVRYGLRHVLHNPPRMTVIMSQPNPGGLDPDTVDVLLIGLYLANGSHCRPVVEELSKTIAILVLSSAQDPAEAWDLLQCVRAGARGHLSPDSPITTLFDAIHTAATPPKVIAPALAAQLTIERPTAGALSPREQQVLDRIACGYTHTQVARHLGISGHTVDTYVKRIRGKLGLGNKADLTRAALLGDSRRHP